MTIISSTNITFDIKSIVIYVVVSSSITLLVVAVDLISAAVSCIVACPHLLPKAATLSPEKGDFVAVFGNKIACFGIQSPVSGNEVAYFGNNCGQALMVLFVACAVLCSNTVLRQVTLSCE